MDKCKYCKKIFNKKTYNNLYCSFKCKNIINNKNRLIRHREKVGYIPTDKKECPICNEIFKSRQHNNVFCSIKCRTKHHNSKEINKQRDKDYKKTKKYKDWYKKYYNSEKYKKTVEKSKNKKDYRIRRKNNCIRYNKSIKGKINSIKYDKKRKHNLKRIKHMFTEEEFRIKLKRSKGICKDCGKYVGINKLAMDHIIPISKTKTGTEYKIKDIQFLCKSCNSKKGVKNE